MATISSLKVELVMRANSFNNSLRVAQKETREFQKAFRPTTKMLNDAGRAMTKAGKALTVGVSLPLTIAAGAALKFSTDFNRSMANVATLIPGNTERINELKTSVQDMAIQTGKSTEDLANGLFQVISAFGDSAESAKILEINAKAAAAGMASTTDAINLTSAVTKGYGEVTAETIQKAADLAFKTNELGQTTFPELAASMGRVIPFAAKLGVSQEELFAGFAALTGVTGTASEVSTQFAAILKAMLKPTKEMKEAMASLGFSASDTMLQTLGMAGALEGLIATTDGSIEATGKLFGRAEALTAVFAITGNSADKYSDSLAAMNDVSGAADVAFGEIADGVNAAGFRMDQFKQRMIVTAQRTGDALIPALNAALDAISPLLTMVERAATAFASMDPKMQLAIAGLVGVAIAIGPLLLVLGQLSIGLSASITLYAKMAPMLMALAGGKGFAGLSASVGVFGAKMKALAISGGPILLAVAAVSAAAVALWKLHSALKATIDAHGEAKVAVAGLEQATIRQVGELQRYGLSLQRHASEPLEHFNARMNSAVRAAMNHDTALLNAIGVQGEWKSIVDESTIAVAETVEVIVDLAVQLGLTEAQYKKIEESVDDANEPLARQQELLKEIIDNFEGISKTAPRAAMDYVNSLKSADQIEREMAAGITQMWNDNIKKRGVDMHLANVEMSNDRLAAEEKFRSGAEAIEAAATANSAKALNEALKDSEARYQKTFDSIKNSAGSTFLAMLSDGKAVFKNLWDFFKNYAINVVFKELLGAAVARLFTPLIGGLSSLMSGKGFNLGGAAVGAFSFGGGGAAGSAIGIGLSGGAQAAGAAAGGGAAAAGGLGGLGALFTGASAIPVFGAIAAGVIIAITQIGKGRKTADRFVKGIQNPFGDALINLVDTNRALFEAGELNVEEARAAKKAVEDMWNAFKEQAAKFSEQGGLQAKVVRQAFETLNPIMSNVFNEFNDQINALTEKEAQAVIDTAEFASTIDKVDGSSIQATSTLGGLVTALTTLTDRIVELTARISSAAESAVRTLTELPGDLAFAGPPSNPITGTNLNNQLARGTSPFGDNFNVVSNPITGTNVVGVGLPNPFVTNLNNQPARGTSPVGDNFNAASNPITGTNVARSHPITGTNVVENGLSNPNPFVININSPASDAASIRDALIPGLVEVLETSPGALLAMQEALRLR